MSNFEDSYFDTSATDLASHTPTKISDDSARVGESWTLHSSYSTGGAAISSANRCRTNVGATVAVYYHSGSPASADYSVFGRLHCFTNSGLLGLVGRVDTAANTFYRVEWSSGVGWKLFKVVAGVTTQLGSTNTTYDGTSLTAGNDYDFELRMSGTTISLYRGVDQLITATDSAISATGKAGLRINSSTGDAGGYHLDNFQSVDPSAGTTITPSAGALTFSGVAPALGITVKPSAGALTIAGTAAALNLTIPPSAGTMTMAGTQAALGIKIPPSTGSLVVTGLAPNVGTGITPSAGAMAYAGLAPGLGVTIKPAVGALTYNGQLASLAGPVITPGTGSLTVTGQTPTLGLLVVPSVGTVTYSGQAAAVSVSSVVTGSLIVTSSSGGTLNRADVGGGSLNTAVVSGGSLNGAAIGGGKA